MMLRRFARKYNTRDIVEEYRSIPMCPLVDGWAVVLTQNLHPTSSTQQAEQASFTRETIPRRASQFSLKINKRQSS
jgi:hypothetical protein